MKLPRDLNSAARTEEIDHLLRIPKSLLERLLEENRIKPTAAGYIRIADAVQALRELGGIRETRQRVILAGSEVAKELTARFGIAAESSDITLWAKCGMLPGSHVRGTPNTWVHEESVYPVVENWLIPESAKNQTGVSL